MRLILATLLLSLVALLFTQPRVTKIETVVGQGAQLGKQVWRVRGLGQRDHVFVVEAPRGLCLSSVRVYRQDSLFKELASPDCTRQTLALSEANGLPLDVEVATSGGWDFAFYSSIWHSGLSRALAAIFFVSLAALFAGIAYRATRDFVGAAFLFLSICLWACGFVTRGHLLYTNDLQGHLSYAQYLGERVWDLFGYAGREQFHPPTYYWVLGISGRFAQGTERVSIILAYRVFNFVLYAGFLYVGLRAIYAALAGSVGSRRFAVALFLFWPLHWVFATRVSNDVALFLFWALAVYFVIAWQASRNFARLPVAAFASVAACIAIKSNGYLVLAQVLCQLGWVLLSERVPWHLLERRRLLACLAVVLVGVAVNLAKPAYQLSTGKKNAGSEHFGGSRDLKTPPSHFMSFSTLSFVERPFVTFDSEPGFWNYFLKSSLYGEFSHGDVSVARALNWLFLMFLVVVLVRGIQCASWSREFVFLVLGVAMPLLGVIVFTWKKKWVVCQDMRFVWPLFISLSVLLGKLYQAQRSREFLGLTRYLVAGVATAFLGVGGYFVLSQFPVR